VYIKPIVVIIKTIFAGVFYPFPFLPNPSRSSLLAFSFPPLFPIRREADPLNPARRLGPSTVYALQRHSRQKCIWYI